MRPSEGLFLGCAGIAYNELKRAGCVVRNGVVGVPMGIRFLCPNGHKLNVKTFLAGKRALCPQCGAKVIVPIPQDWPERELPQPISATVVDPPIAPDETIRQSPYDTATESIIIAVAEGEAKAANSGETAAFNPNVAVPTIPESIVISSPSPAVATATPVISAPPVATAAAAAPVPAVALTPDIQYQIQRERNRRSQLRIAFVLMLLVIVLGAVLIWVLLRNANATSDGQPAPTNTTQRAEPLLNSFALQR
jgi:hypothetical protein